jgi:hypothetical protein
MIVNGTDGTRCITLAAVTTLILFLPGIALGNDGFGRRGFYLGVGAQGGVNFFEDQIGDVTGGAVDTGSTWGVNARAGYRVFSWFAVEAYYEWMDNFQTEVTLGSRGGTLDYTTHTITGNLKFVVPTWRFQPYLVLGFGGQHFNLGDDLLGGVLDDKGWGIAGRPGVGLDIYITKNLVLNAEVAGVLGTSEPKNLGRNITDLFYLSAGGGLQWRF